MNSLRLSKYPDHIGVKTEVNGVELREVRSLRLDCDVASAPVLYVEQFVHPDLDVTLDGVVQPTVLLVSDEFELHVEHYDGHTRYWVTRK